MAADPFFEFVQARKSDLRRIARRTCGEHGIDDVEIEAWLIAEKIATKRGFALDFRNRADQEQVLAWLHNQLVKFADKRLRYAVKLDKDCDKEDSEAAVHSMARLLTAPDTFDPAVLMQRLQDVPDPLELTRHSYSQASAYVILLCRFDWDVEELAGHLHIVVRTLADRLRWFGAWTHRQPALFDGLQVVALDFQPTLARRYAVRGVVQACGAEQFTWDFDS